MPHLTPLQLVDIQDRAAKLAEMYEVLDKNWNNQSTLIYPHTRAIRVMLHNIAFKGDRCVGYTHIAAVEKVWEIKESISAMRKYYGEDDYMTVLADDEIKTIFMFALNNGE